jgi:hypothetical protein
MRDVELAHQMLKRLTVARDLPGDCVIRAKGSAGQRHTTRGSGVVVAQVQTEPSVSHARHRPPN